MKFLILFFILLASCKSIPFDDIVFYDDDFRGVLSKSFPDGTPITRVMVSEPSQGQSYLIINGDAAGNCQIFRTPLLKVIDSMGQSYAFLRWSGKGETCTGKNCSHCAFKASGGCECKNSLNICEHTITRNRDLLQLQ